MRRIILVVTVAAMMAALLMALSGAALAQEDREGADVCVSDRGETLIDIGASNCFSGPTSQAVAVNGSDASAEFDGETVAVNHSLTSAIDGEAVAVNHSLADASDSCSATALNGEVERCP